MGIATVLNAVLPLDISVILVILNVPILLAGVILKGLRFTINTILAFALYVVVIDLTETLPTLSSNPLVAAVFGGMMYGVGLACLVRGNGSTGGTELLSRLLLMKFPSMSLGKMGLIVDGSVVLLAVLVFRDVEVGLYAIIAIYTYSTFADKILLSFDRGELCLIISGCERNKIAEPLIKELSLSLTCITGTGMYSGREKNVFLAAMRPKQVCRAKALLGKSDPNAFVITLPVTEMLGGSYKRLNSYSKRH